MGNPIVIPNPKIYIEFDEALKRGYLTGDDLDKIVLGLSMDIALNPLVKKFKSKGFLHNLIKVDDGMQLVDNYIYFCDILSVEDVWNRFKIDILFTRPI